MRNEPVAAHRQGVRGKLLPPDTGAQRGQAFCSAARAGNQGGNDNNQQRHNQTKDPTHHLLRFLVDRDLNIYLPLQPDKTGIHLICVWYPPRASGPPVAAGDGRTGAQGDHGR